MCAEKEPPEARSMMKKDCSHLPKAKEILSKVVFRNMSVPWSLPRVYRIHHMLASLPSSSATCVDPPIALRERAGKFTK